MKSCVYLIVILCQAQACFGQDSISNAVEFGTKITGDFVTNIDGGIKSGLVYLGKEEMTFGIHTENVRLWKNGFFFIHGLNTHGVGPSSKYVGDLQILSNIEAGNHTGLFELYYMQHFRKLTIIIGQHDLNAEFLSSRYSSSFINSSFGIMPVVSLNTPVSIYPLSGAGIVVKYKSDKNFIYRFGVYDGNPGNMRITDITFNGALVRRKDSFT